MLQPHYYSTVELTEVYICRSQSRYSLEDDLEEQAGAGVSLQVKVRRYPRPLVSVTQR